jgi:UDP-N-acetylmuramoyl-L-alanyl-D-glutamate--2,6-diaminopimelate ligase
MIKQSLHHLLAHIKNIDIDALAEVSTNLLINGLTLDSRAIKEGMLFVALKGTQAHGLQYAFNAQQQGAVAIIWESDSTQEDSALLRHNVTIPVLEVQDLSKQLGKIAQRYYQISNKKQGVIPNYGLKIVGVTGTDGKTTVTHFLAQALDVLTVNKIAVIGTLGIGFISDLQQATHTTPDVLTVHKTLHQLAKKGADIVAMEVSSHALDQGRVDGVDFEVAVLTNLTRDHLDYHGTVEHYAAAKERLFLRPEVKTLVLNNEDAFSHQLMTKLSASEREKAIIRYRVESADLAKDAELVASDAHFTHQGIQAQIAFGDQRGELNAKVLGEFNLSNLLATLSALLALDVTFIDALTALNKVRTVAGRMEKIDALDKLIVVDYAHTPAALASALNALRGHTKKRIVCVFGCGGDRDKGKRPLMAKIAEQNADMVIVTDDNPRTEDPKRIMHDIVAGFAQVEKIMIEHNRAKAIHYAIKQAQAGDVVLIAGKGHEQVQIFADTTEIFDDRQHASQALQELAA